MAQDIGQEIENPSKETEQLKNLWQTVETGWLRRHLSSELAEREIRDAREHPYLALSRLSPADEVQVSVKPGHFIVVTHALAKLQLISEVIQSQGGVAEPVALVDEKSAKKLGRDAIRRWGSGVYSLEIASEKAGGFKKEAFKSGKTLISVDSTVITPRGQILEKPKDEADVERMLKLIKGNNIKVMIGVNALVPLRYGQMTVRLDEGAEITLKIRDLTEKDIASYILNNRESALSISGGIDFSSPAGQELVDKSQPIRVKPLQGTIYDIFDKTYGVRRRPVIADPNNMDILEDYFKGAPKEIIGVLMRQAKEIQEKVERL